MNHCYCDLFEDHILNNPKVLPCGSSACFDCLKKAIDSNGNLKCTCCKQTHLITDPEKLISNIKIANMIKTNLKAFTNELTDKLQAKINSVQSTCKNGESQLNSYSNLVKEEIKMKIDSLKDELDKLGVQLVRTLDEKMISSKQDLDSFSAHMLDLTRNMQTYVNNLNSKADNNTTTEDNMYLCEENLRNLGIMESDFSKIFSRLKFKPNDIKLNAAVIGDLLDSAQNDVAPVVVSNNDAAKQTQQTTQAFDRKLEQKQQDLNSVPQIIDMTVSKQIMEWPCGLCNVGNKELIITDNVNNELVILNADFEIVKRIQNIGDVQFTSPFGICTDDKDNFFVCDGANHRILILNRAFTRIKKIVGKKGKLNGEFVFPLGISFYAGYLYVTDHDNRRIQVFTCNGDFIKELKLITSSAKRRVFVKDQDLINSPWCLSITDDTIAVLDFCGSIYVYNFDGQLKSVIDDHMVNSILIVDQKMYLHSNDGTFTCYERNRNKSDQHQYQMIYKHTYENLESYSAFMVYFNQQVIISFGEKKYLAVVKTK